MRPTGSAALATLVAAVAVVLLVGGTTQAAPVSVCTVNDIIIAQAPTSACTAFPTDPCALTLEYQVDSGCALLFGDRDVVVSNQGSLLIGSGTVTVSARSFTVAPGGLVDGSGTFGASLTVTTTENITVARNGGTGRVILMGESRGGSVLFQAGRDIVIDGILRVDNGPGAVDASAGDIVFRAVRDIVTGNTSNIAPKGGGQGCGGTVDFLAGGRIEIGNTIDATGGDGGSIDLTASGNVILRDRLSVSGIGDAGSGGCVTISALVDAEISGPVESRGATGPDDGGCGGAVSIEALGGDVTVRDTITVSGGGPDGGAGSIELSTLAFSGGSIDVTSAGSLEAEGNGSESCGGFVSLDANLDIMVDGAVLAGGGDSGGDIDIDAGSSAFVRERTDVHGRSPGGSAGEVTIDAGTLRAGNVMITDKIDASGAFCDDAGFCGDGGSIDVSGCDVTLAGSGSVDLRGPGATGAGGDVILSARRQLTVQGDIDTTGQLAVGKTTLVHPSLTAPVVTPGVVTPPPLTPVACSGECPGLLPPCFDHCRGLCDCGDGAIDQFEQCDGASGCTSPDEVCGAPGAGDACVCLLTCSNGVIDPGEQCDSTDFGGMSCSSLGFPGGALTCTSECTIDDSTCDPITCGDGGLGDDEVCEPDDLGGESCQSLGFVGGVLACGPDCTTFDEDGCDEGRCGDGIRCFGPGCSTGPASGPEECDDGDVANDDACLNDCVRAVCGDGRLCTDADDCSTGPAGGVEECDDGVDNADDAPCSSECATAACGDNVVCTDPGCTTGPAGGPEECDGGVICCSSDCELRGCPDGLPCVAPGGCCHPDAGCDDQDPCTTDHCNLFFGCSHTPIAGCCSADGACDDGNPCTDDVCDLQTNRCVSTDNAAPCDDGDACTRTDVCSGGVCSGSNPVLCTALDVCHQPGECDAGTGRCSDPPKADGSPCRDGDLCNGAEACQGGVCAGGAALDCDDSNPCTADSCDAGDGCTHAPVEHGATCADTDRCNGDETCQDGLCAAGSVPDCDDGNPCTADTCDPATGCRNDPVADGASCTDGDACNGEERCAAGQCAVGSPLDCDDGNVCTADACDASAGCQHDAVTDGTDCGDGDRCNGLEVCAAGVCIAGVAPDCADDNACTADRCDPSRGCENTPVADGGPCGDADICNGTETCQGGLCADGTALDCDDDNACTMDGCDAGVGCSHTVRAACCLADAECDDGNPCTDDRCAQSQCQTVPNTAPCDDGNACTRQDVCDGSVCVGGDDVRCVASDQCHGVGVCDPATGACSDPIAADGVACSDGDACSAPDTCQAGQCIGVATGLDGFGCTLERLAVPDLCADPLPGKMQRLVDRQLTKARKARTKAELLIAKGAKARKIEKQVRKMEKALQAIEKSANRAEATKKGKQRITAACANTIRGLVAEPLIMLASVQP